MALPPRPPSKDRWLTREEAARLLRSARQTPHLARFILVALYTGIRKDALLKLQWLPNMTGGHIDLETGVRHRQSAQARRTKKRQPPARLPRKLLNHLRRWRPTCRSHVVEFRGSPVASINGSWREAVKRSGIEPATPHDLRRTAITWRMQAGVRLTDASNYFGVTVAELEKTYFVHHPDFQQSILDSFDR